MIAQPDKQDLVKDCYYERPPMDAARRYWQSREWQAIRDILPVRKGRVLDSGAGHGITSFALAMDGWEVTALEPDPGDLVGAAAIRGLARDSRLPIKVLQEVGEKIPCNNEEFDLVFARQLLHHAQDLGRICREFFRVLKPGGIFLAVRDHVISSKRHLSGFLEKHPLHRLYGGENAYRLREYLSAIRGSGFTIIRTFGPFDSVINYAPYNEDTLRDELRRRLIIYPGGGLLSLLLGRKRIFHVSLKILSKIDRRPGRMFSFICSKPQ